MGKRVIGSLLVLGVVVAACGDDDRDDGGATTEAEAATTEADTSDTDATEDTGDASGSTDGDEPADTGEEEPADTAGEEPTEEADVDPDGVLRIAYDLVASQRGGVPLDPSEAGASTGDLGLYHWVYGGLMRPEPDGTLVPDLAEEATVVDESTIEIVLREGLQLSDGTQLDGEMVKASLERNLEEEGVPAFGSDFFKLSDIEVVDPTTVRLTIPDGTAAGWFDMFIGGMETVIVPPDTDFSQPEGFGPFRIVEYVPEERFVLERNPDYWNVESIQLARIEGVNAPEAQSAASALNAGQVDWARLEVATMDSLDSGLDTFVEPDPNFVTNAVVCKSTEPFDDPRVRQALSMAIDRDVINEALFGGHGEVAWDLWPEDHPLHNPDLTGRYAYDPEGARELLADAGYPDGFEFEGLPIPSGGMPEMAQVLQQQFADIGVTMNISQSANFVEDLYLNNTVPVGFVPSMGEAGTGKLRQWVGQSIGNICGYEDPQLAGLADELQKVSRDSDEAVELWHQIQEVVVEDVLSILVLFQPRVVGFDAEVIGADEDALDAFYAVPVPDVYNLHIRG